MIILVDGPGCRVEESEAALRAAVPGTEMRSDGDARFDAMVSYAANRSWLDEACAELTAHLEGRTR